MIPVEVLKALGTTLANFVAGSKVAQLLRAAFEEARDAGKAAGTYFRFINAYVAKNAGSTRQDATTVYYRAKAWTNQGEALSRYHRADELDQQLAREIPAGDRQYMAGKYTRSWVSVLVTDRTTGKSRDYGYYIDSFGSPNLGDLYDEAKAHVADIIKIGSKPGDSDDIDDYDVEYRILDFARYV